MFIRHQALLRRLGHYQSKELLGHIGLQQTVAVLAVYRRVRGLGQRPKMLPHKRIRQPSDPHKTDVHYRFLLRAPNYSDG